MKSKNNNKIKQSGTSHQMFSNSGIVHLQKLKGGLKGIFVDIVA
jgi:hypothetical protein